MKTREVDSTPKFVQEVYQRSQIHLDALRRRLGRPLTLTEKVLLSHLESPTTQDLLRGESLLRLWVDRVIMQDATAQMALLQFVQSGRDSVAVPTTIHCDHLIRAKEGAQADLQTALGENKEVYDFLKTAAAKFGIGFWGPGSGIIHQVVLETYAFPGGLMIGSDSHTPNSGGLGMMAIGVGGADTVDAMAGFVWEILNPKIIGVRLSGELKGWSSPKDVILWVAGKLTVKGGTNCVIEYFGPGVQSLSATGRSTIANMGAEIGATTSIFPYDERTRIYLRATGREELVSLADQNLDLLCADPEVEQNPSEYFDQVLELNLSELAPQIVGPFTPDLTRPISALADDVKDKGYPKKISATLIGSCTNSSYEDIVRASEVAQQALKAGLKLKTPLMITPGSAQIFATVQRDGLVEVFEELGAQVLANACGPCIGQWSREDVQKGEPNSIVNSYNRNFPGRNDDNPQTAAFVTSPEVAVAYSLVGDLQVNPLEFEFQNQNGELFQLKPPEVAPEVPTRGYVPDLRWYSEPAAHPQDILLRIPTQSERLQILEPFEPVVEPELANMPVLMKTKGKTTTDHISPAGFWLRYRGHLSKISENLLLGAINAWTNQRGLTFDAETGEAGLTPAEVAKRYQARKKRWVIVGDENYGEGSSREHAAMSPRYLGAAAVIAKSFARIHESNLKKQGILPLTFADPNDYERIQAGDSVTLEYLHEMDPVRSVNMLLKHKDGSSEIINLKHSMTLEQMGWFHAGSALNLVRKIQGHAVETPEMGLPKSS